VLEQACMFCCEIDFHPWAGAVCEDCLGDGLVSTARRLRRFKGDAVLNIQLPAGAPASEFSEEFAQKMASRMATSFFKYGAVADAYPTKVDALASLKLRLAKYEETGNTEYLVDVGNFAMIEFMHPRHPDAHFKAEDSAASPGRAWHTGHVGQDANTHTTESARRSKLYAREGD
jgi:hypothetical protein